MHLPAHHLSKKKCKICAGPLTVHQEVRGGTCDAEHCRRRALHEELAAIRAAIRQTALRRHGMVTAEAQENAYVAILPAYSATIANLPEKRRRRLRDRVLELIGRTVSKSPAGPVPPAPAIVPTAGQQRMLGQACALCQGRCCQNGAEHAWLQVATIRRVLAERPELRPRHVLDEYLSYLPSKTYAGSCVYHTATGCALPRSLRSDTCNNYLCDGLSELLFDLRGSGPRVLVAAATSGSTVQRSQVIAVPPPIADGGSSG
ncbi:MAG TPA: hypothetical protein VIK18_24745 [Pirellulales bacterium]